MSKSNENFCLLRVRNVGQFSKILALNNERKLYYQPTFENLSKTLFVQFWETLLLLPSLRLHQKFVNFIKSSIFDEQHWCFNDSKNIKG